MGADLNANQGRNVEWNRDSPVSPASLPTVAPDRMGMILNFFRQVYPTDGPPRFGLRVPKALWLPESNGMKL